MNPHFKHVPSLATLTAGCLSRRHFECLRGQADGTLDTQLLGLGTVEQFAADFLERGDFARGQGDADLVGFL